MSPQTKSTDQSTITLTIEKLVYQGWGMGKHDGYVVFVPNTLPGDTIKAKYLKKTRRWAKAICVEYIEKSNLHQTTVCEKFGQCGGCQLLDVPYADQINLKRQILDDCFRTFLPNVDIDVRPFVESPASTFYRNKMEFSFGQTEKGIYLGLKKRGDFRTIIPLSTCYLMSETANTIMNESVTFFNSHGIDAWNPETHAGTLRHLTLKRTQKDDQYMVILSVNDEAKPIYNDFAKHVLASIPKVKSIYLSVNQEKSDTAFSLNTHLLGGTPELQESLSNLSVRVTPLSFFQTNAMLFETLYETVQKQVSLTPSMTVLDLYCGTGTIGLFISKYVKHVIGIEENQSAIDDANLNAKNNGITNATFYCGRVKNILKFNTFTPDLVIVDPPRSGMVPKALRRTAELKVPKIIYVSCNPVTMARDLKDFMNHGYIPKHIEPVDMFPNTFHMETVTLLELS